MLEKGGWISRNDLVITLSYYWKLLKAFQCLMYHIHATLKIFNEKEFRWNLLDWNKEKFCAFVVCVNVSLTQIASNLLQIVWRTQNLERKFKKLNIMFSQNLILIRNLFFKRFLNLFFMLHLIHLWKFHFLFYIFP